MNRKQYDSVIESELHQAISLLQQQFPALAGREVRIGSVLRPLVANVASHTRAHELLGLRTADELAEDWGVSVRRAQAFIASLHERFGVGRRIGKLWVLSPAEAESHRPGKPGRPKDTQSD